MSKLSEIKDKLEKEFMSDIGYKGKDRFTNSHSPYYGKDQRLAYTDDSTSCKLYCDGDDWYVEFTFRNVSDDYAIDWCKNFLQEHDIKFNKVEPIYTGEKGWFSVEAHVSKKSICERYGLYDEYLEVKNSDKIETYNKLIETIENLGPTIKNITDINDVTDMSKGFGSYFRFGDDSDHVSIRIGGKDAGHGLTIFSVVYIKEDGNTTLKSDYTWSNNYKEHINKLKTNIRFYYDHLTVVMDLYNNLVY